MTTVTDPITGDQMVDILSIIAPELRSQRCLDHGFVKILDCMPRLVPLPKVDGGGPADNGVPSCDFAIADAARQSYQKGTRRVSADAGLIDNLVRNRHTSPIEMGELKFHIRLPIFVMRQHVRHRTACISGDMRVSFDLPGGVRRRGNQHYTLTVRQIMERRADAHKWGRVQQMMVRSVNEETGEVYHTRIKDAWSNGQKAVRRVTFDDGSVLEATDDHRCLTDQGWLTLRKALERKAAFVGIGCKSTPMRLGTELSAADLSAEEWRTIAGYEGYAVSSMGRVATKRTTANDGGGLTQEYRIKQGTQTPQGYLVVSLSKFGKSKAFHVHRLVLDAFVRPRRDTEECRHGDGYRDNNRLSNLSWGTALENADDRKRHDAVTRLCSTSKAVVAVEPLGMQEVYDIEVAGPYHNFAANGTVVHNSLNEESARYSELASDFYIPDPKDWAMNTAADKQATVKYQIDAEVANVLHRWIKEHNERAYALYRRLLDGGSDDDATLDYGLPPIAREQARMVLGVNIYTQCVWKIDLKNLLHYLSLRCDKHAQYEIRVFADAIARVVEALFPHTLRSFKDHDPFMDGVNFGRSELQVLASPTPAEWVKRHGWTERRFREFAGKALKSGLWTETTVHGVVLALWPKETK